MLAQPRERGQRGADRRREAIADGRERRRDDPPREGHVDRLEGQERARRDLGGDPVEGERLPRQEVAHERRREPRVRRTHRAQLARPEVVDHGLHAAGADHLRGVHREPGGGGGENGKNGGGDQKQLEMAQKLHEKQLKKVNDDLAAIRAEHEKTQRALKEYQLWTPLRELFLKGNGDASEWELARLDLANQQRFGFDDENKIVVLEDGMPSSVTPRR